MPNLFKAISSIFSSATRFDLQAYEDELWQCKGQGIPLPPPPSMPGGHDMTDSEITQYESDLEAARQIYERVKKDQGWRRTMKETHRTPLER
jgi:hypothetical protein